MVHTKATFGRNHISRCAGKSQKQQQMLSGLYASNRCLLASVQLLQQDHTIHKQGSISPHPPPSSLQEGGSKYKYCRGIKTSRWWQQDLMRSGSDMGIHVVLALIILSFWELKVQVTNTALNRPPSCYVLLSCRSPLPPQFCFFLQRKKSNRSTSVLCVRFSHIHKSLTEHMLNILVNSICAY